MRVTEKGQVTIPKHIREATGVLPGSEVEFRQEGGKIIITKASAGTGTDRRKRFERAARKVAAGLDPEFEHLSADDIIAFLRPVDDDAA